MSDALTELKERLSKLSDEQLIQIVTKDAADYRQEALDYAKAELKYRRVDLFKATAESTEEGDGKDKQEEPPEEEVEEIAPALLGLPKRKSEQPGWTCSACGGQLRRGTLVGEKEITIVFSDTRQERFVQARACVQCGQISFVVDYDTDVEM